MVLMVAVNGQWSRWTSWSSCSATCGRTRRERVRMCDNPRSAHGGARCPGRRREKQICPRRPMCPGKSSFPISVLHSDDVIRYVRPLKVGCDSGSLSLATTISSNLHLAKDLCGRQMIDVRFDRQLVSSVP